MDDENKLNKNKIINNINRDNSQKQLRDNLKNTNQHLNNQNINPQSNLQPQFNNDNINPGYMPQNSNMMNSLSNTKETILKIMSIIGWIYLIILGFRLVSVMFYLY